MPILTSLRQSPTYLYIKVYCLCALVTLFQAAPVSSRIPQLGQTLQLNRYRLIQTRLGPRIVPVEHPFPIPNQNVVTSTSLAPHSLTPDTSNQVVISPEVLGPNAEAPFFRRIVMRWRQRARDLAQVQALLRADVTDRKAYPELDWDATVRRSSSLHPEESKFLLKRQNQISCQGSDSLRHFLSLSPHEKVDPRDVPLVALGGSGGGYRAMYGFAGFIAASKRSTLWDCISWAGGVSGSCWTLAAYYTIAYQDAERLVKHFLAVANELAHPMSVNALDTVARSSRGVYFLLGPLIRKAQAGIVGLGIMDLYATLTTTYQFLSREPRARLSRATFQFSRVWDRSGINEGKEPLPIFTAVRVAPRDAPGVRPHTDSSLSKGQPPNRALTQHQSAASKALTDIKSTSDASIQPSTTTIELIPNTQTPTNVDDRSDIYALPVAKGYFQWFEATPLEVGSSDVQGYLPTWAWGRPFVSGRSLDRRPEESLSLLLGQCTSAPAGPLTGYISALLASLPKGTVMSRILHFLNNFVRMKRWEKRWGNPIRAGDEPNPFYGLNVNPVPKISPQNAAKTSILGIGIDILHLPRLQQFVHRRGARSKSDTVIETENGRREGLDKLAKRILCKSEQDEYAQVTTLDSLEKYLATRWVAKEAAYKALYPRYVASWKDLCVHKPGTRSGAPIDGVNLAQSESQGHRTKKPVISFSNEWKSKHPGVNALPKLHLSVSHDGEYVVANVLAEDTKSLDVKGRPQSKSVEDFTNLQVDFPSSSPIQETLEDGSISQLGRSVSVGAAAPDGDISPKLERPQDAVSWESSGRIRLMDSGMSNNLPNHILARIERGAEIIIAFDASSDVQAGSAMRRIHNFADDCQISLSDCTHLFNPPGPYFDPLTPEDSSSYPSSTSRSSTKSTLGEEIEQKFLDQYARVLKGKREVDESEFWLIYCPLLPNKINAEYDPATSNFSNSYNLVWTPTQIKSLLTTSEANLERYALHTIRQVLRHVYEEKKAARLSSSSTTTLG
ncbi:related to phospholipase A2, cytosolic [Melanopsichium pennsylvanicum]|uniref:Lysophospholipase n=2 Tax=Melanopsichium pennsylvanicum TaxID=63383 RepID=A0AAJ4XK77_9BASI|nr:related to phospholipase A2, cytosolic [Melanopsichium pennsylvanicum 4]SNX83680.1 related to phospholipase A2, cytosolic [Melanopsichium pennsylvanicum]